MQENEQINHEVTTILLKRIIELLDTKEEEKPTLQADEVRAALRNELSGVIKSIKAIPESDHRDILKELKALQVAIKAIEMKPEVNVAAANIPDVIVPEIILPEITIPAFDIPTPVVNYTPPEIHIPAPIVNVPAPIVNVPEVDLSAIIRSLEVNLNKLRTNGETRPLAVRMTDGQNWIRELKELNKNVATQVQYQSDQSYIKSVDGTRINPATEETLSSIAGLIDRAYDYVSLTPPSLPTTIVFKEGGSSGTTVATLTLVYSGTDLSSVTRT